MADSAPDVTQKLLAWREGSQGALNELLPLVYSELRRLARYQLRRGRNEDTMQSAGLVNEAYLRLVDQDRVKWKDRAHFFGLASNLMRGIVVDHYRTRHAAKRGGYAATVPIDEAGPIANTNGRENMMALDQAITRLEAMDAQQARIVELRYFGGLSIEETAEVIGVSPATVKNKWNLARSWLHRELTGS
jgi:RNA polymerase sigma factor (TIGR02999 family)